MVLKDGFSKGLSSVERYTVLSYCSTFFAFSYTCLSSWESVDHHKCQLTAIDSPQSSNLRASSEGGRSDIVGVSDLD